MYKEHFGLKELPFSIAPDPRYLFMSDQHREALAHLVYGINSDSGLVLLTGEVGTGKTTVCRCLLGRMPENTDIAYVLNPKLTVEELLATVCDELGMPYPEGNRSIKVFVDLINVYLLDAHARGRKTVLILEEAQNLGTEVLEQLRLLTNLETNERKLLQIIMVGQPELRDMLSRPEMLQVAQRITARYHLGPLSRKEVSSYVAHRLAVAGGRAALFPAPAMRKLYRLSGGVPRLINLLCDRALLGAYAQGRDNVDVSTLVRAAREVFGEPEGTLPEKKLLRWVLVSFLLAGFGGALATAFFAQISGPVAVKSYKSSVAAEKPAEPVRRDELIWPADRPLEESKDSAYEALFKQWNFRYEQGSATACQQAQTQGVRCFEALGNLSTLMSLNRPAVLKLYDDRGREFYATLIAIQGQSARVMVGSETRTVDAKEISKRWYGDYMLLWQAPPGYRAKILPGSRGPDVQWIERQLAFTQGRADKTGQDTMYGEDLIRQVKKFQLEKGLVPDGVAGAQTIIHLNNAVGSSEPRLSEKRGAG